VRGTLGAAGAEVAAELEALDRLRYAEGRRPGRGWWSSFAAAARRCPKAV
jgi:hypothetical protein